MDLRIFGQWVKREEQTEELLATELAGLLSSISKRSVFTHKIRESPLSSFHRGEREEEGVM